MPTAPKMALIAAACAALAWGPATAGSPTDFAVIDAHLKTCLAKNGSTQGVNTCNAIATSAADRRLNDVYGKLANALKHPKGPEEARDDSETLRRLVTAERAWIAFRDADCSYQSSYMLGGTGESNAYSACLYAQTKARVGTLTAPDAPQRLR